MGLFAGFLYSFLCIVYIQEHELCPLSTQFALFVAKMYFKKSSHTYVDLFCSVFKTFNIILGTTTLLFKKWVG